MGDLAEAFPRGELKEVLSAEWVMDGLKAGRTKAGGPETKKVAKWAREVSFSFFFLRPLLLFFFS
jgi:importin subunit beta-1